MEAMYDSECSTCGTDIHAGDEIVNDDGQWVHEDCGGDDAVDPPETIAMEQRREVVAALRVLGSGMAPDDVVRDAESTIYRHTVAETLGWVLTEGVKRVGLAPEEPAESPLPDPTVDVFAPCAPQPPLTKEDRDRYGRYRIAHPNRPGKTLVATRCTTLKSAASDPFGLGQWNEANVARGLAARPDLVALVGSLGPDDRRVYDVLKDAKEAGGGSAKANLGTAIHAYTEAVDHGAPLSSVPDAYRADVRAYRDALTRAKLFVVPMAIERVTMTSAWDGVAGTFDRIYYNADDRVFEIGDVKTGKVGYDPKEMFGQLAMYAKGVNEVGVYDVAAKCWVRLPFHVRTDVARIVHVPAGGGTCAVYTADLAVGRMHMDMCAGVRRHRKLKHPLPVYEPAPMVEGDWWEAIQQATTRDQVTEIGRMVVDAGAMTADLRTAARARMEELPDGG